MKIHQRNQTCSLLLLLLVAITANIVSASAQNSVDRNIFLNCGSSSGLQYDLNGLPWEDDNDSAYDPDKKTVSVTPTTPDQNPAVPTVPYMTARIFQTPYTYSFPVIPGRKFVRLHFYTSDYTSSTYLFNFNISLSFFSFSVGSHTLLNNFSAPLTNYIRKEFSVNISSNSLNLTFTPSPANKNAFAFVNGIEIVSMAHIFVKHNAFRQPLIVGTTSTLTIDEHTAFEMVARLNVGGQSVSPVDDSGLYREGDDDSAYIYGVAVGVTNPKDPNVTIKYTDTVPEYIAPPVVYGTARSMGPNASVNLNSNLTWIVTVHTGFYYYVRLHFCEIKYWMMNMRVFDIFINGMTAQEGFDVIGYTKGGGIGVPVYLDFIVFFPNMTSSSQQHIRIDLHPNISSKPVYCDAVLNGLEIFKLNDRTGNLAGLNPTPLLVPSQTADLSQILLKNGSKKGHGSAAIMGGVVGGAVGIALVFLAVFFALKKKVMLQICVSSPSNQSRLFSISEIKTATKYFSESLVIGVGGFGKVYRGDINGGSTCVAIKRGSRLSNQGAHEFQTEIDILSKLRHRHLVSLVGHCHEKDEMILVYDYMANGTLRDHLYETQNPPLSWKQRLEICIGAARGFHYLHTGAKPGIIHRDVKTTNILLDDKWVSKVSDFGLSKAAPELDCTHVSTGVKGTFGYLDPEYYRKQQLTDKSDVYSFGVVLFEVLCGRPALDRSLPEEQVSLADWALHYKRNGMIDQIIDPHLKEDITQDSLEKFVEISEKCLANRGIERPLMGDVLWNLEVALQMHNSVNGESNYDQNSISSYEGNLSPIVVNEEFVFSDLRSMKGR